MQISFEVFVEKHTFVREKEKESKKKHLRNGNSKSHIRGFCRLAGKGARNKSTPYARSPAEVGNQAAAKRICCEIRLLRLGMGLRHERVGLRADKQQAQRARLFLRWFNGAEQQKHYVARSIELRGEEGEMEYIAIIVQRSNPQLDEILTAFDVETTMFNEQKPQE